VNRPAMTLPPRSMTRRASRATLRFPMTGAVVVTVSATAALIVWITLEPHQLFAHLSWLMPATFAAMGSLIVWRQPRNTVRWIVLLSGPFAAIGLTTSAGGG